MVGGLVKGKELDSADNMNRCYISFSFVSGLIFNALIFFCYDVFDNAILHFESSIENPKLCFERTSIFVDFQKLGNVIAIEKEKVPDQDRKYVIKAE